MKIGTSFQAPEIVDPRTLVPSDQPVVFVIGALAHGSVSLCTMLANTKPQLRKCIVNLQTTVANDEWHKNCTLWKLQMNVDVWLMQCLVYKQCWQASSRHAV